MGGLRLLARAMWLGAGLAAAHAQAPLQDIKVATRLLPPFVMGEPGGVGGFSIELWNAIAERTALTSASMTSRRWPGSPAAIGDLNPTT